MHADSAVTVRANPVASHAVPLCVALLMAEKFLVRCFFSEDERRMPVRLVQEVSARVRPMMSPNRDRSLGINRLPAPFASQATLPCCQLTHSLKSRL